MTVGSRRASWSKSMLSSRWWWLLLLLLLEMSIMSNGRVGKTDAVTVNGGLMRLLDLLRMSSYAG